MMRKLSVNYPFNMADVLFFFLDLKKKKKDHSVCEMEHPKRLQTIQKCFHSNIPIIVIHSPGGFPALPRIKYINTGKPLLISSHSRWSKQTFPSKQLNLSSLCGFDSLCKMRERSVMVEGKRTLMWNWADRREPKHPATSYTHTSIFKNNSSCNQSAVQQI